MLGLSHPNNIWQGIQIIKLLVMWCDFIFLLLRPSISLSILLVNSLCPCSSLNLRDHIWHKYKNNWQNYSFVSLYHHAFRQQLRREKIHDWAVESIPQI
jgi:hypothetical protein